MKTTSFLATIVTIFLYAFLLTSCGSSTSIQASDSTHGQQLLDLQKAFESGAITKDEYEDAKEEILDNM